MDAKGVEAARKVVAANMIDAGAEALQSNASLATSLIAQRRLPAEGWPQPLIEMFLSQLACMDTNNFLGHAGGGEREGRVASQLVARRHFHMTHGIGRSGDIVADQPKAAGSSLMAKLTNFMALDAIRAAGVPKAEAAVAVPLATGMSLALVLQAVRQSRPRPEKARYVIWPRIDQKTSLKCITAAGLEPIVVQLRPAVLTDRERDACGDKDAPPPVVTETGDGKRATMLAVAPDDVAGAIRAIAMADPDGADAIACVLGTTSCFAPRVPDDVLSISRACKDAGVPLVVNNAYGLQSRPIAKRLDAALQSGAVTAFVQSMDKNFLTPVGGSVIAGPKAFIKRVSELYPGRASAAPIMDLFITLLEIGRAGWHRLHADRLALHATFLQRLRAFAEERGETLLSHPRNDISVALTLRNLPVAEGETLHAAASALGAALFRHRVTGPKVILPGAASKKSLCGTSFTGYGTHSDATDGVPPMLVVACGVGMTGAELDTLMVRLGSEYPVATSVGTPKRVTIKANFEDPTAGTADAQ